MHYISYFSIIARYFDTLFHVISQVFIYFTSFFLRCVLCLIYFKLVLFLIKNCVFIVFIAIINVR